MLKIDHYCWYLKIHSNQNHIELIIDLSKDKNSAIDIMNIFGRFVHVF